MKRLVKKADNPNIPGTPDTMENTEDVKIILNRIDEASDGLKDIYYVLFDNLNALFEAYPNLYKQMQMVIKLPSNEDAEGVVKFHDDLHQVLEHFKDDQYLQTYIGPQDPENEDQQSQPNPTTPQLPE